MQTVNRYSKLPLSASITLKNRVVIPAMASETADENGFVTANTQAHYQRLAKAGAGLILVEYTYVSRDGRSEPHQLGVYSDAHIVGLSEIAKTIKSTGARAGLQIVHGGGKTTKVLTGGFLLAPSAIAVPAKDRVLEVPAAMTLAEIAELKEAFLAAAGRAEAAGFDMVELHAAHGYGLNQWISPITNQRTDAYGGDHDRRLSLIREVIIGIRRRYPRLLIGARLPGQDFVPGGLTVEDMKIICDELVEAGLNVISISSGLGGWRRPSDRTMEGYLVEEAAKIQAHLRIPVIGVGGIESGAYIDDVVGKGTISLTAVGRAILANPESWRQKNLGAYL